MALPWLVIAAAAGMSLLLRGDSDIEEIRRPPSEKKEEPPAPKDQFISAPKEKNPYSATYDFGNHCFPLYYEKSPRYDPLRERPKLAELKFKREKIENPYTDAEWAFLQSLKPIAGGRTEATGERLDGCDVNSVADRIGFPKIEMEGSVNKGDRYVDGVILNEFRRAAEKALQKRPWLLWKRGHIPKEEKDFVIDLSLKTNGLEVGALPYRSLMEEGGYGNFRDKVLTMAVSREEEVFFPEHSKFERTNPAEYGIVKKWFNAFRKLAEQELSDYLMLTRDPKIKVKYFLYDGSPEYVRNRSGFRGRSTEKTIEGKKYLGVFISLEFLIGAIPSDFQREDLYDLRRAWSSGGRTILHEATHAAIFKAGYGVLDGLPYWATEGIPRYFARQDSEKQYQAFTGAPPKRSEKAGTFGLPFVVEQVESRPEWPMTFDIFVTRLLGAASNPKIQELLRKKKDDKSFSEVREILERYVRNIIDPPLMKRHLVRGDLSEWVVAGASEVYARKKREQRIDDFNSVLSGKQREALLKYSKENPMSVMAPRARAEGARIAILSGAVEEGLRELEALEKERPLADILRWVHLYQAEGLEREGKYLDAASLYRRIGNVAWSSQQYVNDIALKEIENYRRAGQKEEADQSLERFQVVQKP